MYAGVCMHLLVVDYERVVLLVQDRSSPGSSINMSKWAKHADVRCKLCVLPSVTRNLQAHLSRFVFLTNEIGNIYVGKVLCGRR